MRRTALWVLAAVAGVLLVAGVTYAASSLTTQPVGISSEPQLVIKGAVIVIAVFLSSAGGVQRISGFFRSHLGRRSARTAG